MARGDVTKAAVLRLIAASAHSVTIKYPPKRVAAAGTPPALLPMTPLTGPAPLQTALPGAPVTPEKPDKVVKCLWYDSPSDKSLEGDGGFNKRTYSPIGWRQGSVALIRVAVGDVALDPAKPYGRHVFDECESVEHFGTRYRIAGVVRSDAAFNLAYTYYVWLASSEVG